jgi:hypothetical protein
MQMADESKPDGPGTQLRQIHALIADDLPSTLSFLVSRIAVFQSETVPEPAVHFLATGTVALGEQMRTAWEAYTRGYLKLCKYSQSVGPAKFRDHVGSCHHAAWAKWLVEMFEVAYGDPRHVVDKIELRREDDKVTETPLSEPFRLKDLRQFPLPNKSLATKFKAITAAELSMLQLELVQSIAIAEKGIQPSPAGEPSMSIPDATGSKLSQLSASQRRVFDELVRCGHRMTKDELASVFDREGDEGSDISEATVKTSLATLMAMQMINNAPRSKPRGYGLPSWP